MEKRAGWFVNIAKRLINLTVSCIYLHTNTLTLSSVKPTCTHVLFYNPMRPKCNCVKCKINQIKASAAAAAASSSTPGHMAAQARSHGSHGLITPGGSFFTIYPPFVCVRECMCVCVRTFYAHRRERATYLYGWLPLNNEPVVCKG